MEGSNRPLKPTVSKSKREAEGSSQQRPPHASKFDQDLPIATSRTHNTRSRNLPCIPGLKNNPRRIRARRHNPPSISASRENTSVSHWVNLIPPVEIVRSVEVSTQYNSSARSESVAGSSSSQDSITCDLLELGVTFPMTTSQSALAAAVLKYPEIFGPLVASGKIMAVGFELENSRNVSLEPSMVPDTYNFESLKTVLARDEDDDEERHLHNNHYQDKMWDFDKIKCVRENEAIFQRTLMMSMINRFRFFPDNEDNLFAYFTEQGWNCPIMPTRGLYPDIPEPRCMALPKPDLCVCFQTTAIIPKACSKGLSIPMHKMISVEGLGKLRKTRAFPFLSFEAKNGITMEDDEKALYQSLNAASQALHNMYEFCKEADMEDRFFEVVRYITVTATASGCVFRMHRAMNISEEDKAERILPDYPLKFEYDEIGSLRGRQYTRQAVLKLVEKIIWAYGPILGEELKKASTAILATIKHRTYDKCFIKRTEQYYRHGQDHKKKSKESAAPSEAGTSQALRQHPAPTPATSNSTRTTSVALRSISRASYSTARAGSSIRGGTPMIGDGRRGTKRSDIDSSGVQAQVEDEVEEMHDAVHSFDNRRQRHVAGDRDDDSIQSSVDQSQTSQQNASRSSKRQRRSRK